MFEDFELDNETGMDLEKILPTNIEEARAFICNDEETMLDLANRAGLSLLLQMLFKKGIIDEVEFSNELNARVEEHVNKMAEMLMMKLEEEVFEYEKD